MRDFSLSGQKITKNGKVGVIQWSWMPVTGMAHFQYRAPMLKTTPKSHWVLLPNGKFDTWRDDKCLIG